MIRVIRLLLITYCAIIMSGCHTAAPLAEDAHEFTVLVVNSNSTLPRYNVPAQAFSKMMGGIRQIQVDLADDEQPIDTLQDILNKNDVHAVYCIGAKALGSVDYLSPATPIIYSSVLSWREFQSRKQFYGVTDGVAPAAQLAWFKHFFPDINTIGILYSETSAELLNEAKQSAEALSLTIQAGKVSASSQREKVINELLDTTDAIWVLPDPVVLDSEANTIQLFELAHRKQVPVFAYNQFFMELGATLSINADLATTGRQAALMIRSLKQNVEPENNIQFPAGSNVSLNLRKVKQYRMTLDSDALNSVSELLDQ